MPTMTKVATKAEIPPGSGKVVQAGEKTLALFNCDGTFYAIDNVCLHRGGPLGEGSLSGASVTCPWHGWEYDIRSGECTMDASMKVQKFDVKVEGDDIFVNV